MDNISIIKFRANGWHSGRKRNYLDNNIDLLNIKWTNGRRRGWDGKSGAPPSTWASFSLVPIILIFPQDAIILKIMIFMCIIQRERLPRDKRHLMKHWLIFSVLFCIFFSSCCCFPSFLVLGHGDGDGRRRSGAATQRISPKSGISSTHRRTLLSNHLSSSIKTSRKNGNIDTRSESS